MKKYCYPLLVLLSFVSCTKEIPFPEFEMEPSLVINAIYSPEEDFVVEVSTTAPNDANNTKPNKITTATVTIREDVTGGYKQLAHVANGYYTLEGFRPIEGGQYSVEVSAPNFAVAKSVLGGNNVPKSFSFSVDHHHMGFYKNTESFFATIIIEDDPTEENYYLIEIIPYVNIYELTDINSVFGHFSNDPNSEEIDNSDETNGFGQRKLYLPDTNFSGTAYTLSFWWSDPIFQGLTQTSGNYVACHVRSVSKIYYEYERSLEQHKNTLENEFATPINVISNIDSGFGIFAGFNTTEVVEIDL